MPWYTTYFFLPFWACLFQSFLLNFDTHKFTFCAKRNTVKGFASFIPTLVQHVLAFFSIFVNNLLSPMNPILSSYACLPCLDEHSSQCSQCFSIVKHRWNMFLFVFCHVCYWQLQHVVVLVRIEPYLFFSCLPSLSVCSLLAISLVLASFIPTLASERHIQHPSITSGLC